MPEASGLHVTGIAAAPFSQLKGHAKRDGLSRECTTGFTIHELRVECEVGSAGARPW